MTNTYFADALVLVSFIVCAIGIASGNPWVLLLQLMLIAGSAVIRVAGNHNQGN